MLKPPPYHEAALGEVTQNQHHLIVSSDDKYNTALRLERDGCRLGNAELVREAFTLYVPLASSGHEKAMCRLGRMYAWMDNVTVTEFNLDLAMQYFQRFMDRGYKQAFTEMGIVLFTCSSNDNIRVLGLLLHDKDNTSHGVAIMIGKCYLFGLGGSGYNLKKAIKAYPTPASLQHDLEIFVYHDKPDVTAKGMGRLVHATNLYTTWYDARRDLMELYTEHTPIKKLMRLWTIDRKQPLSKEIAQRLLKEDPKNVHLHICMANHHKDKRSCLHLAFRSQRDPKYWLGRAVKDHNHLPALLQMCTLALDVWDTISVDDFQKCIQGADQLDVAKIADALHRPRTRKLEVVCVNYLLATCNDHLTRAKLENRSRQNQQRKNCAKENNTDNINNNPNKQPQRQPQTDQSCCIIT